MDFISASVKSYLLNVNMSLDAPLLASYFPMIFWAVFFPNPFILLRVSTSPFSNISIGLGS